MKNSYNLPSYLILIIFILTVCLFQLRLIVNKDKLDIIIHNRLKYQWFFVIISVIILITIIVFFTFSFIFAVLIFGLIIFIYRIQKSISNKNVNTIEEFPIYVEPIEIKTNCDGDNDGCKIPDNYPCYVCDGGIHYRHW